jgi:hypothetical protein
MYRMSVSGVVHGAPAAHRAELKALLARMALQQLSSEELLSLPSWLAPLMLRLQLRLHLGETRPFSLVGPPLGGSECTETGSW